MNAEEKAKKTPIALAEEKVLKFWEQENIFAKSTSKEAPKGDFVFYDGPPYGTGLPHYGHLLPGTIKDVIPRYKTMQGYRVNRRWGWDCHGLPIENLIEKELGLETKKDIEEYGIDKFNQAARDSVLRYEEAWKQIIPRTGRWVDMSSPYKTMDPSYMESVWWVFKTLSDKGLVSEGFKAMHVCPRCETPLSNFEVNQGYEDVKDISVTAKFELVDQPGTYVLAWTTTPWTLPGNVALAVGGDIEYVKVEKQEENGEASIFIVAKERISEVFGADEDTYTVLGSLAAKELVGQSYRPVFDYYADDTSLENKDNGWKIYAADFVTTEDGTGVVHIAPAFGSDDYSLLEKESLPFVQHVTIGGKFKPEVTDFAGMKVKEKDNHMDTDIEIVKWLAHNGKLFSKQKIEHSYPHCWRCDTPLLNYATSSWFIDVPQIKDQLLDKNKKTSWVPSHIRDGRFGRWLEGARPWAVSRARYWGTPLPVWKNDEGESLVIGGVEDLKSKIKSSGNKYYYLRHGESLSNEKEYLNSDTGAENPLTEKGVAQAKAAAADFKDVDIDLVFVSPLQRTQETAKILQGELGWSDEMMHTEEAIREFEMGEFEGVDYHKFVEARKTLKFGGRVKDGESYRDVVIRVGQFMEQLESQHQGKNILIVSHGGVHEALHTLTNGYNDDQAWEDFAAGFAENATLKQVDYVPLPHDDQFVLDLHRPYIDDVVLQHEEKEYRRIPEVFDVWFDSGSMPYAQSHYPFTNADEFTKTRFPANFIAEGQDQTRGWFYTLSVLGVALFGVLPFENVVVNGMVLAEDGKKMSKRLKNYPEIGYVMDKYGMDAFRLVLMSSPAVRSEDLRFSEKILQETASKVMGRLRNIVNFYEMYGGNEESHDPRSSDSVLDKWILSKLDELTGLVTASLESYEIDKAGRAFYKFADEFSTWYVRRSRDRFKGEDQDDKLYALSTTAYVLRVLSQLMAPFTPFIAEEIYQKTKGKEGSESVHLSVWPEAGDPDEKIMDAMQVVRDLISQALELRDQAGIKVRQPLASVTVPLSLEESYQQIVLEELNVKQVIAGDKIALDTEITDDLKREGQMRELVRQLQSLRKKNGLMPDDEISLVVETSDEGKAIFEEFNDYIKGKVNATIISFESVSEGQDIDAGELSFVVSLVK